MRHNSQHTVLLWGFLLWSFLCIFHGSSTAKTCERLSTTSRKEWESNPKREGDYRNCAYRYAITIPKGLVARGEVPTHTEHGVGMWLSDSSDGYIWVDGGAASPEGDFPLDEHADRRIRWIEKNVQRIVSVQKTYTMLDTLPAIRLTIQYVCPNESTMVDDYFFALNGSSLEYTVALSTDIAKYEEYKIILEQIAKTFQLLGDVCPSACNISWREDASSLAGFEGDFESCRFGYALTIPMGFVGRMKSIFTDDSGLSIVLSTQPRGLIMVETPLNVSEWSSLDEIVEEELARIEKITKQMLSVQQEPYTLAGLSAIRLTARYICSDDTMMVKDIFFVLHQERKLVYAMWLLADDATYEEYKPILEQLVKTFQLREISCE